MKSFKDLIAPFAVAEMADLIINQPAYAIAEFTDLVVVRYREDKVSVLYGRCIHRGALLADGHMDGHNLVCGVHNWDYRVDSGVSEYNPTEALHKFDEVVHEGTVYIDRADVVSFEEIHPSPFKREDYLGSYADTHPDSTEPYTLLIKELAQNGLKNYGHHGPSQAMGVDRNTLPKMG